MGFAVRILRKNRYFVLTMARLIQNSFIFFCAMLFAVSVNASSYQASKGEQQEPRKTTIAHSELDGTVEVSFRVNESGRVDILTIAATSPQLADYVMKKLGQITLDKDDPQIGQIIRYRFVFRKQA